MATDRLSYLTEHSTRFPERNAYSFSYQHGKHELTNTIRDPKPTILLRKSDVLLLLSLKPWEMTHVDFAASLPRNYELFSFAGSVRFCFFFSSRQSLWHDV